MEPPAAPQRLAGSTVPDEPALPLPAGTPGIVLLDGDSDDSDVQDLQAMLTEMIAMGGSDLHLSAGLGPWVRVHGSMKPMPGYPALTARMIQNTIYSVLSARQRQKLESDLELDTSYSIPGVARFRVNVFWQRGSLSAALRVIPWDVISLKDLGMPDLLAQLMGLPRGLVLITGQTGSGKTTTLAAMLDHANRTRHGHILTIEDPIEFIHPHRSCIVNQREVGGDTSSFAEALRRALRQDPDIILIGEMRDLETISIALTAAETGHLVVATLHTQSAAETCSRIIDAFPAEQQQQVRTQLAAALQAVICQALPVTTDKRGRLAALEIMVATPAVRNLIRENKLQSIPSVLQTSSAAGMRTMNQDLADLVKRKQITAAEAMKHCTDPLELKQLL